MRSISLLFYTCARMLKSVLDNSGSRQGQETANPTCYEAMRVQKNEQVFTNIITKKTTMAIVSSLVGAISSHFPYSFFHPPPPLPPFFSSLLFLLSFSFLPHLSPLFSTLSLLPTHPQPHLPLLFLLSSLFFDLVTRDVQLHVDVNFSQVLAS